jgi:hypothetical protein
MKQKIKKKKYVLGGLHQTGKTYRPVDIRYQASKPGKRISKKGLVYYERRKNRSDIGRRI